MSNKGLNCIPEHARVSTASPSAPKVPGVRVIEAMFSFPDAPVADHIVCVAKGAWPGLQLYDIPLTPPGRDIVVITHPTEQRIVRL